LPSIELEGATGKYFDQIQAAQAKRRHSAKLDENCGNCESFPPDVTAIASTETLQSEHLSGLSAGPFSTSGKRACLTATRVKKSVLFYKESQPPVCTQNQPLTGKKVLISKSTLRASRQSFFTLLS